MNNVTTRKYNLSGHEQVAAELILNYLNDRSADKTARLLSSIVSPGKDQCTIEGRRLMDLIDAAVNEYLPAEAEPPAEEVETHLVWLVKQRQRDSLRGSRIVQNMSVDFADWLFELYKENRI